MDINTKIFVFKHYFIPIVIILFLTFSYYTNLINKIKRQTKTEVIDAMNKFVKSIKFLIIFLSIPTAFIFLILYFLGCMENLIIISRPETTISYSVTLIIYSDSKRQKDALRHPLPCWYIDCFTDTRIID